MNRADPRATRRRLGAPLPARRPKFTPPGQARLKVALDVQPLVGEPSGVGAACRGLLLGLLAGDEVQLSTYTISRKAFLAHRELAVPVAFSGRPVPTRLAQRLWLATGYPPADRMARYADVLHGTNFAVPPTRRAATVVTVHDLTAVRYPELCTPATLAYPSLVRKAVERGALVHVPSSFVRGEVVECLGVDPALVHVVAWGVPPVREPVTLPPVEPPYLLALGTVEPRKDYPGLVEAFAELAATRPELRLVIAGADGWGAAALTAAIAERALEDRVVRLGYVSEEERCALLWNATVLVYPSVYEGFGFPPLEAMTAGVPVVASAVGAVPEVVGDGALLVPPGEPALLAEAIGRLVDPGEEREALVARGRAMAMRYDWRVTAHEMVGLYRLAAERRGS